MNRIEYRIHIHTPRIELTIHPPFVDKPNTPIDKYKLTISVKSHLINIEITIDHFWKLKLIIDHENSNM